MCSSSPNIPNTPPCYLSSSELFYIAAWSVGMPINPNVILCSIPFLFLQSLIFWKRSEVKVTQLCPTLCSPMDYTVHGILQARTLEWVAVPFSRGSSQPRDETQVSRIAGRFFTS